MIPLLSYAEVKLTTSPGLDCDDYHSQQRSNKRRPWQLVEKQQRPRSLPPPREHSLLSAASSNSSSSSTWTHSTHSISTNTRSGDALVEALPDVNSTSSHSHNHHSDHHPGSSPQNGDNNVRSNRRRISSVSFQETLDVLEFEKLQESKGVAPTEIWYTKEELREIRSQCRQKALETERTDGVLERGLEHMVPRGSPRHSKCRRQSKEVVFMEQANEILEHGFLYDTEQLADEYRRASEVSKRQARSRGCNDAVRAWGDVKGTQIAAGSISERNLS